MSTDSQKLDMILEKTHSIDIRLSVLESSVKGLPVKVARLESDSKGIKLAVKIFVGAVPVLLVLIRWLGLSIETIGD